MLVALRIVGLIVAAAIGTAVLAWLFTGERRWLRVAWVIFKFAVFALAGLLLLFAGEAVLRGR